MGCSVAYHLAKLGWRDVVLLEQGRLSCGTTWHAAGLVGQLRAHQNMTRLVQYSADLYARLEAETGQATGWKQCGSVLVARTPERVTLFKRIASAAKAQGVACELISIKEAAEQISGDAHRRSRRRAVAAARRQGQSRRRDAGAGEGRAHGRRAHLRADARHRDPSQERRRRPALRPAAATSRPRSSSIAPANGRSRSAGMCGVTVPLHSAEHMYIVTGKIDGVHPRPAGAARSRRLHLRQGRGRRAA